MDRLKTKALQKIEERMERVPEGSLRHRVLESARDFKTSWIDLGRLLYQVWKEKLYRQWGYTMFESYTAREIGIRKETALKLLKSYGYLEKEAPGFLAGDYWGGAGASTVPTVDAIDVLRRARERKGMDERDYTDLKHKVLEKGLDAGEARKDLTRIIREREEDEPEEARKKKRLAVVRRFIGTLKSLRREADLLHLLPGPLIKETDRLIHRLEKELS